MRSSRYLVTRALARRGSSAACDSSDSSESSNSTRLAFVVAAIAAVAAVVLATGCEAIEPDVGPPVRDICQNEDSEPDNDVSFSRDIATGIFADPGADCPSCRGCRDCHAPDGSTPLGFEVSGLNLSSFGDLLAGGVVSGGDIVIPGQPCDSVLLQKVSSGPPFGSRMPLDGPPFLDAQQRQLLADWIAEGARDN